MEHGDASPFQCCRHNPEKNMPCTGMYGSDGLFLSAWHPSVLPQPRPAELQYSLLYIFPGKTFSDLFLSCESSDLDFLIELKNQNRRRGPTAYTPPGKRIFPEYKKRRLPTDRRTPMLTVSAICRKQKTYVIFCRMEKPCNPQLNYRAAIIIYPVFPRPNFRLSLHPICSPSAKENLWTFYRQPPSIRESIR